MLIGCCAWGCPIGQPHICFFEVVRDRKDPSDQREDRINRSPKPRFGLRVSVVSFVRNNAPHKNTDRKSASTKKGSNPKTTTFCFASYTHMSVDPRRGNRGGIAPAPRHRPHHSAGYRDPHHAPCATLSPRQVRAS